jgi:hypothetical protein
MRHVSLLHTPSPNQMRAARHKVQAAEHQLLQAFELLQQLSLQRAVRRDLWSDIGRVMFAIGWAANSSITASTTATGSSSGTTGSSSTSSRSSNELLRAWQQWTTAAQKHVQRVSGAFDNPLSICALDTETNG